MWSVVFLNIFYVRFLKYVWVVFVLYLQVSFKVFLIFLNINKKMLIKILFIEKNYPKEQNKEEWSISPEDDGIQSKPVVY